MSSNIQDIIDAISADIGSRDSQRESETVAIRIALALLVRLLDQLDLVSAGGYASLLRKSCENIQSPAANILRELAEVIENPLGDGAAPIFRVIEGGKLQD
ncbi:MAG: hypothetical protein KGL44_09075 [Sphingomonadales bacterium]|nr:hypothetical protein [Sphingomonadales bacterium]